MISNPTEPRAIESVVLAKLLDFLELSGELLGEGLLKGLEGVFESVQLSMAATDVRSATDLGLAGRVAAQAVEGSGLNNGLSSHAAGAKSRGSKSQGGSHCEKDKLITSRRVIM